MRTRIFLAAMLLLCITSCGNVGSNGIYDEGSMQNAQNTLLEYYPDANTLDFYQINFRGDATSVSGANLYFKGSKEFRQKTVALITGRINESWAPGNFNAVKPRKYSEFDFSSIHSNITKAIEMVVAKNPNLVLDYTRVYSVIGPKGNGTQTEEFELVFKDSTETPKMRGRYLISNRYEFKFKVESGEMKIELEKEYENQE